MNKRIYLSSPHMCGDEIKYIEEAFAENWVAPAGPALEAFEKSIANYTNMKCAVALSSATAAIHLALKALGVGAGDYVFCSDLTFAGSCNPVTYVDAIPIFIDSEYSSWNMDPKALEAAYEKYPNPKAIVVVNLYGQCADYDALYAVARKHNTPIIEDAAESLGATYKGKASGSIGDVGIVSFNGNKIITTSGGGMFLCNDEAVAKKVRFWSTQSREPLTYYEHKEIGYNYRMSNICASIGLGQMNVLPERVAKKKYIYEFYKKELQDDVEFMPVAAFGTPNYWLTTILLHTDSQVKPEDIITKLSEDNIESRHAWKPMHLQPVFASCDFFSVTPISCGEDVFNRGVCLPSDTKMTDEDLLRVIHIIKETLRRGSL